MSPHVPIILNYESNSYFSQSQNMFLWRHEGEKCVCNLYICTGPKAKETGAKLCYILVGCWEKLQNKHYTIPATDVQHKINLQKI